MDIVDEKHSQEEVEKLPFRWLLNFSDCEGLIGTEYCQKLYQDFVDNEELVKYRMSDRNLDKYYLFKEAFKLASNNGLVVFFLINIIFILIVDILQFFILN